MIGRRLLHYEIAGKLGEGGMGVVYRARDAHLDRFVAIKVLPPEKVADPSRKVRFAREAKAASALNHPNIITIYDISSDDGLDFIVMEYVAGKTLDQMIPRKGMRVSEALKVAVQVAGALACAHAAGIIHRDLKPTNIMVDDHGQVKVLDFGLAKLAEKGISADDVTVTAKMDEGTIVGTPAYMSPEQVEGKPLDAQSDIFSFGAVLYEMLTGQPAFQGASPMSTLAAVIEKDPAPLGADIPRDLQTVVARCLRKDPARRFHHSDDLCLALEELKEECDSGRLTPAEALAVRIRRRMWWIAAVAASLPLALLAAWFVWFRERPAEINLAAGVPFTTLPGAEVQPTLSPDGARVAFVWNGERQDNWDIYVKQIRTGAMVRLTTDPAIDMGPSWSPDGEEIAFIRAGPAGGSQLMLMPAIGGRPRVVAELADLSPLDPHRLFPLMSDSSDWLKDGKHVVTRDGAHLAAISIVSGEKRVLTKPDPTGFDGQASISPDGWKLAFLRSSSLGQSTLCLLPLKAGAQLSGDPQPLLRDIAYAVSLAWVRDGRDLLIGSRGPLSRLNTGSGKVRQLTGRERHAAWATFSPAANRLVYSSFTNDSDIWQTTLAPSGTAVGTPRRLIRSTSWDGDQRYSPDGRRVAFSSGRSGVSAIWTCASDGTDCREVAHRGASSGSPSWSPDGRFISFDALDETGWRIWMVGAEGRAPWRLDPGARSQNRPAFSADGLWVYYEVDGGRSGIWKAPATGNGPPVQVTRQPGIAAAESSDGKDLYFLSANMPFDLCRIPVSGGESSVVLKSALYSSGYRLFPDGVYYVSALDPNIAYSISFHEFATGKNRLVHRARGDLWPLISISPDRRSLLYTQWEGIESDLVLVEDFR